MRPNQVILIITIGIAVTATVSIYLINTISKPVNSVTISQSDTQETSNVTKIIPGSNQLKLCRSILYGPTISVMNSSGFQVYNYSGIPNYVIVPSHHGTIRYEIQRESFDTSDVTAQKEMQIFNDATFYHVENMAVHQDIVQKKISLGNGTTVLGFEACYQTTGMGQTCYSRSGAPPPDTIEVQVPRTDHPGIQVSFDPTSEMVEAGSSGIITMTIAVDTNAPTGTYWFAAPTSCSSPQLLLTIGTGPYNGTLNSLKLS